MDLDDVPARRAAHTYFYEELSSPADEAVWSKHLNVWLERKWLIECLETITCGCCYQQLLANVRLRSSPGWDNAAVLSKLLCETGTPDSPATNHWRSCSFASIPKEKRIQERFDLLAAIEQLKDLEPATMGEFVQVLSPESQVEAGLKRTRSKGKGRAANSNDIEPAVKRAKEAKLLQSPHPRPSKLKRRPIIVCGSGSVRFSQKSNRMAPSSNATASTSRLRLTPPPVLLPPYRKTVQGPSPVLADHRVANVPARPQRAPSPVLIGSSPEPEEAEEEQSEWLLNFLDEVADAKGVSLRLGDVLLPSLRAIGLEKPKDFALFTPDLWKAFLYAGQVEGLADSNLPALRKYVTHWLVTAEKPDVAEQTDEMAVFLNARLLGLGQPEVIEFLRNRGIKDAKQLIGHDLEDWNEMTELPGWKNDKLVPYLKWLLGRSISVYLSGQ